MLKRFIAVTVATLAVAGCAEHAQPRADFELLAAQTPWKLENGRETRELTLNGVTISQERTGSGIRTLTIDQSGHGAVMCSWKLYAAVLTWAELCRPDDKEWQGNLATALDRINDFIVANDLSPITKQQIEAKMANEKREMLAKAVVPERALEKVCRSNSDAGKMFGDLKQRGYARLQADVDALLSVPRPPALNPCF